MKSACRYTGLFLSLAAACGALSLACWAGALAHARSHQDPPPAGAATTRADDPERQEQLELGRRAFQENCLMCHADDMTVRLRLTPTQWTTEVDKMIGWGAPVPPEQKEDLVAYLTSAFSSHQPHLPLERITPAKALVTIAPFGSAPPGDPGRGGSLYASQCATCHGPDARGAELGTNLVEKPILLRPAEFLSVVRAGRRRMPGFEKALSDSQAAEVLAWLREKRFTLKVPAKP